MNKIKLAIQANRERYKHIVAWGKQLGSYDYYIDNECHQAALDNAPATAIYKRDDKWRTIEECCQATQDEVNALVKML